MAGEKRTALRAFRDALQRVNLTAPTGNLRKALERAGLAVVGFAAKSLRIRIDQERDKRRRRRFKRQLKALHRKYPALRKRFGLSPVAKVASVAALQLAVKQHLANVSGRPFPSSARTTDGKLPRMQRFESL